MADTLHILEDLQLDENLRYIEIGDTLSPIEISKTDLRLGGDLDLGGDLYLGGSIIGNLGDTTADDIICNNISMSGHLAVTLNLRVMDNLDATDYFNIQAADTGQTTLGTVDAGGADGHIRIYPDGHLILTSETNDIYITDTNFNLSEAVKISFNGGGSDAKNGTLTFDTIGQFAHGSFVFKPDAGGYFLLDFDNSNTGANSETSGTEWWGLRIDYDKTGSSTSNNTVKAIEVDVDYTSATDGTNNMYGIYCTPTLTHASDAGTTNVVGGYFKAVGGTNGTSTSTGIIIDQDLTADTSQGLVIQNSSTDYFRINVAAAGATTLQTIDLAIDGGGSDADLTLDVDGDVILDPYTGITKFYKSGDTDDYFKITVVGGTGATTLETVSAAADGHLSIVADGHCEFDGCAVGFDLETPTYNASDTDVSFITGNKQFVTFGSGNITDLNLIFPKTSGNFVLMLKQDGTGSRTVTNYKVWDIVNSDAASGSATVKFAGGSNPTLTTDANHVDIISFFYDADNQIAYGVASLDFQF